jgi:hypothetical protein
VQARLSEDQAKLRRGLFGLRGLELDYGGGKSRAISEPACTRCGEAGLTRLRVGELSFSAICSTSARSSRPSSASWILAIVMSSERRRVEGEVAVVPSDVRRPWPAIDPGKDRVSGLSDWQQ